MEWETVGLALGTGVLGVGAAPVTTWLNHVAVAGRQRRERDAEEVRGRSEQAAVECFADLAQVEAAIAAYTQIRDGHGAVDTEARDAAHDKTTVGLGGIEARTALLAPPYRAPMQQVVEVLRVASDLGPRPRARHEGWHPDSTHRIVGNTVRYGREVLATCQRREPPPDRPDVILEYLLAMDAREAELNEEFAQEVAEEDSAVRRFRESKGLPPVRRPWPLP